MFVETEKEWLEKGINKTLHYIDKTKHLGLVLKVSVTTFLHGIVLIK